MRIFYFLAAIFSCFVPTVIGLRLAALGNFPATMLNERVGYALLFAAFVIIMQASYIVGGRR